MKLCYSALLATLFANPLTAQIVPYRDAPYAQDYSIKYYTTDSTIRLQSVSADRNGVIQILSSQGLLHPRSGQFQYPGTLILDRSYRPMADRKLTGLGLHEHQLVYLDSSAILSNAWAGKLFSKHKLPGARLFCGGSGFTFLVSDGTRLKVLTNEAVVWEGTLLQDQVKDIRYEAQKKRFWVLGSQSLNVLDLGTKKLTPVFQSPGLTCFDVDLNRLYVGTTDGYYTLDATTYNPIGSLQKKLPCSKLTTLRVVHGHLWFGSSQGAFMLRKDGKFNYYYGERWLPGNQVTAITEGADQTVLILTNKGLGEIHFDPMTLYQKALVYEKQVRQRHIRYGFNCDVTTLQNGDLSTAQMGQRDSDNLWTSMYLVSQLFRYKVTGSKEALQNCLESFAAMERLFSITGMSGFFARGFERRGYHKFEAKAWDGGLTNGWNHANDPEWDWRGTTSSDQTVGQMFTLTLVAELMDGDVKKRAITLIDQLMTNIIKNDWYLIDVDGKPTLWGKWNPTYVNGFAKNVGDRKINSSNIIAFLQAAYHFTNKPIYKQKAYELMQKHGYLENLMRPMREIGKAPPGSDDWAKMLSEGWNHSDDEMYFLAYWPLYRYAFTPELKAKYREAIRDHWQAERPEKDGLWNLCYAMTGAKAFDLAETAWYLREFPLDMIEWPVMNSHRKDIELVPENFRGQTTKEVLPPDERPELKHNRNLFKLDRPGKVVSELSAGDSFLLPYWMGRYLGAISAPVNK
ncbi:hypothetical protein GO730_11805 [Spirosoma sp. HMF3257]|uniref:Transcriptional regulator n=1 Tax=Spirosoma telluris TaxID=2183553 RepID=A0A327NIS4_9BACT|nr:hypothetical protein [Spirosoma telluris]RAI74753.1 hypothetical protein HMF3257_11720 [Spirosoma telluris]